MKRVEKNHRRVSWSFERNLVVWSRADFSIGKCKKNFDIDSWTHLWRHTSVLLWQFWKLGWLDCYSQQRKQQGGKIIQIHQFWPWVINVVHHLKYSIPVHNSCWVLHIKLCWASFSCATLSTHVCSGLMGLEPLPKPEGKERGEGDGFIQ